MSSPLGDIPDAANGDSSWVQFIATSLPAVSVGSTEVAATNAANAELPSLLQGEPRLPIADGKADPLDAELQPDAIAHVLGQIGSLLEQSQRCNSKGELGMPSDPLPARRENRLLQHGVSASMTQFLRVRSQWSLLLQRMDLATHDAGR